MPLNLRRQTIQRLAKLNQLTSGAGEVQRQLLAQIPERDLPATVEAGLLASARQRAEDALTQSAQTRSLTVADPLRAEQIVTQGAGELEQMRFQNSFQRLQLQTQRLGILAQHTAGGVTAPIDALISARTQLRAAAIAAAAQRSSALFGAFGGAFGGLFGAAGTVVAETF